MSRSNWKSIGPRVVSSEMGPGDPARGEKVPRCHRCGMPDRARFSLNPGLWGFIRFHVEVALCDECIPEVEADHRALCHICFMPDRARYPLYPGLWAYIQRHIDVKVCGECIQDLLPARVALDPVTLEEVA